MILKNETVRDVRSLASILSKRDRNRLFLVSIFQVGLSVLDLIGVALIGVVGALAVSGVRSEDPAGKIGRVLGFLRLDEFTFQSQTIILTFTAVLLLVLRTLLSIIVTRKTLYFLSRKSAEVSSNLISRVMAQPLSNLDQFTSQYIHYALTTGTTSLTVGVFGNTVSVISDAAIIFVLSLGIAIIDPMIAFLTVLIFGSILIYMYVRTNRRTKRITQRFAEISIDDSEALLELIFGYREAFIRNRRGYFVDKVMKIKREMSDYSAELAWMPNISKYVVEIAFTVGTMIVAAAQFIANDSAQAVGSLTLFLAASTRITPALLRIQQNLVSINGNIIKAKLAVELFAKTDGSFTLPEYESIIDTEHVGFSAHIEISNLTFRYPDSEKETLSSINLQIHPGETIAIVGPSGAGKSTLVDLILGIYAADAGEVKISGYTPAQSILKWPGAIGYVPQEVILMSASIAENIRSGFDSSHASENLIAEATSIAQLDGFISSLPLGILTQVGERGGKLSGGQRQRIGIARAMFTKPRLLVLDEATSALDGQTESEISEAIQSLKGKLTVIVIAHRLSTVQKADKVIYLKGGKIISQGSFDEVRKVLPDFDKQAILMGQ